MPIYEYVCKSCNAKVEMMQSIKEKPKRKCPKCGALKLVKQMSMSSFSLKGGGWYKEGYDSTRNGKGSKNNADSNAKPKEKKTEKPEKKKETKKTTTDKS